MVEFELWKTWILKKEPPVLENVFYFYVCVCVFNNCIYVFLVRTTTKSLDVVFQTEHPESVAGQRFMLSLAKK